MKLFLIIYTSGQIGGSVGPLPYDMAECEIRRDELRVMNAAFISEGIDRSTGKAAPTKNIEIAKTLRFECEFRQERPKLEGVE